MKGKTLHQRLAKLDADPDATYYLDYLTMKSGFIYRNAKVYAHDEHTVTIRTERDPANLQTLIDATEIASVQIITE